MSFQQAPRYFSCFDSASDTVRRSRSHVKPINMGDVKKGTSLEGSHGIPNVFEMLSTSARSYVNTWPASWLFSLLVAAKCWIYGVPGMLHMVHSCIYVYVSVCACITCTIYILDKGPMGSFPSVITLFRPIVICA